MNLENLTDPVRPIAYGIVQAGKAVRNGVKCIRVMDMIDGRIDPEQLITMVDSLRLPTFKTFEMSVPPTQDEQTASAAVLSDMDAELAVLEQRLTKTRTLKQAMMQELLTGKTRLNAHEETEVAA